jgi:phosphoesterase RecJ-like protein
MSRLEELLQGAKKVALSGHIRPDGDCVGSVMSVYQYIKKNMPEIEVKVFLETPASVFGCIAGVEDIDSSMETTEQYDVFIAMDCTADRLGNAQRIFDKAKTKINIDHHVSNQGCGDINIIVPDASSTCEVIYELLDADKLDVEIAKTLYSLGAKKVMLSGSGPTAFGVFEYESEAKEAMDKIERQAFVCEIGI